VDDNNSKSNCKTIDNSINLFSKHLHWLNWDEMVESVKNIGFNGIDLTVRPGGHVLPERVEDDLPKVHEICERVGIKIEMICTDIQNAADPNTKKILKTASQLGINNYRMGWYYYDKTIDLFENLKIINKKMRELAGINEQYKIKGNYQNHDGIWFGAPIWDLGNILREINSDWLGCQYDILNATIESSNSWPIGMELVAPYIHTIDIKDAIWTMQEETQKVRYVPFGLGIVNFKRFRELLNQFQINVPFSLHMEYNLGGVELGLSQIQFPKQDVLSAIEQDFVTFKNLLNT